MDVYFETYGCSANQSHSEVMKGVLESSGCRVVSNPENGDVLVVNTCIVKDPTEKKMISRIQELKEEYTEKKMIVAGCMPIGEYDLLRDIAPDASFLGPNNCLDISECIRKTKEGKKMEYLDEKRETNLCHPRIRFNPWINIVEISQGCRGNCAYCIVKRCKGDLKSYPLEKIKEDVEKSLKGCKEIWLTSQDCGCYGLDRDKKLVDLLKRIREIKGKFRVRIGMMNPNHILPMIEDLKEQYKDEKIYEFLHVPVQSASDRILKKMNRFYKKEDFKKIIKEFRKDLPNITVWTDVIVGFPGETEEDFSETLELIREVRPDFVNVSKFGLRPGTKAEKMEQVDSETIKKRSKKISEVVRKISLEKNKEWIGKECEVLITKKGREKNQYIGRNKAYKSVLVESKKDLRGKFVKVKIKSAKRSYLKGVI